MKIRLNFLIFILIVVYFIVVQFQELCFLLPWFSLEDERVVLLGGLKILRERCFSSGTHKYPFLIFLVSATADFFANIFLNIRRVINFNSFAELFNFLFSLELSLSTALYAGRVLIFIISIFALLVFYFVFRKRFGEIESLLGCFLLVSSPAFLFSSHLLKNDVLVLVSVLLSIFFSIWVLERKDIMGYFLGGLSVGFGVSSKYHFLGFFPLMYAHWLNGSNRSLKGFFSARFFLFIFSCVFWFFIFSPDSFFDITGVIKSLKTEALLQLYAHPLLKASSLKWYHLPLLFQLSSALPLSLGLVFYFFSIPGLYLWLKKLDNIKKVILSYALVIFFYLSFFSRLAHPHLYLPLVPFFSLFCAEFFKKIISDKRKFVSASGILALAITSGYGVILYKDFVKKEEELIFNSIDMTYKFARGNGKALAFVPYFPLGDFIPELKFYPQFMLSSSLLENERPNYILVHNSFYCSFLDNPELNPEEFQSWLMLKEGKLHYLPLVNFEEHPSQEKIYSIVLSDLKCLNATLFKREGG